MMKIIKTIVISLFLLGLVSSVSGYPPIPAEFYGTVTINGVSAPVGTTITASIEGSEVGTITTTSASVFGGAGNFQNRLIVQGKDTDIGKTIIFRINSVVAPETAIFNPGVSQQRDLSIVTGTSSGSTITPPRENTHNLQMEGLQFTVASPGTSSQATISIADLETSGSHMTVSGTTVTVTSDTYTLDMPAAGSIDEDDENGILSFTPLSIQLNTKPVAENINTVGEVTATIQANLNNIPDGAQIITTISQQPTSAVSSSFQLAATTSNLQINDVAYTLNVARQNIHDGTNIADATIKLSVGPDWVTAHGGVSSIRIIRTGDDGNNEVLDTTFAGYDSAGRMVFEGYSPRGLSTFGLVATTYTGSSSSSSGGNSGYSSSGSGGYSSNYNTQNPSPKPGQPRTFIETGTLEMARAGSLPDTILSSLTTILSRDSVAAITLNKGIVVKDRSGNPITEISINPLSTTDISLPSDSGIDFVGYAYEFGPDGAVFEPPVILVFTIPQEKWNTLNLEKLTVRQYNSRSMSWDPVDTRVNSATKSVTASIAHFTKIGLFETGSSIGDTSHPIITAVGDDDTNGKGKTFEGTIAPNEKTPIWFNPVVIIAMVAILVSIAGVAVYTRVTRPSDDNILLDLTGHSRTHHSEDNFAGDTGSGATKVISYSVEETTASRTDNKTLHEDVKRLLNEIDRMKVEIQHKNEIIEDLKKERDWLRFEITKLHDILSQNKKE